MIEISEFKGRKVIKITEPGDKFPFVFGLNKAKKIIGNIEEIRKFVRENDNGTI